MNCQLFLLKRGLWLVFIELTIITFAWYFDIRFRNFDLAVIWSLGISMIFLAALIHLPKQHYFNYFLSLNIWTQPSWIAFILMGVYGGVLFMNNLFLSCQMHSA